MTQNRFHGSSTDSLYFTPRVLIYKSNYKLLISEKACWILYTLPFKQIKNASYSVEKNCIPSVGN